ncbi:HipA domain-containing protein [Massilibacteroides sp.]|uniref:type II toxin-antitoxin system HipA family toxin n=1 Tax=Massilibacteroides sp. TaxID=2034766 RepID=UPI0026243DC6|nr:HipA domain-containing protein [Massilibacteroides sp.]MDD4515229.1 HipA domain-containing protein [Massilibacteroides sp.]
MEETLHICPSLLFECKGESGYSKKALKMLFKGKQISEKLPYERFDDNETIDFFTDNSKRISVSGVQIKYSVIANEGVLHLTKIDEQGEYILKPIPNNLRNKEFCPANEHLSMQIAAQVYGIPTALNGLCFFKDGSAAYITGRFDILNGKKLLKEDFASLAGLTRKNGGSNYKYSNLSYEECAGLIDKYSSVPQVDKLRFFELLLFNFVFCNGDAHLKNFSMLEDKNGKFRLSPAYDLLNTHIHVDDSIFALSKGLFSKPKPEYFGISSAVIGKTFQVFGEIINLPTNLVSGLLDKFCTVYPHIDELIENSFLSEALKKEYKRMYKSRINSFLCMR